MVANTFVDPALGIVMRNSVEFPNLYVSECGQWLYNSNRKNYIKKYMRNPSLQIFESMLREVLYTQACGVRVGFQSVP